MFVYEDMATAENHYSIWQSAACSAAANVKTSEPTDLALTHEASDGDMQAFEVIYQRHNRRVYSVCLRMTKSVSEAEDLTQEVFISSFEKSGAFGATRLLRPGCTV